MWLPQWLLKETRLKEIGPRAQNMITSQAHSQHYWEGTYMTIQRGGGHTSYELVGFPH